MNGKKNSEREVFDRLADALIDDILNTSDEEILEELREYGVDPEANTTTMLALFEQSVVIANKQRLADAKAAVAADRATITGKQSRPIVNLEEARRRLRAIRNNPRVAKKLTLAARKESELSDADILSLMEDLVELGAIQSDNDHTENPNGPNIS